MPLSLLDTDTLSEVLKQKDPIVVGHASAYLGQHARFSFSAFTRYEIIRGLTAKGAVRQLQRFATVCLRSQIIPITDAVLDRAADLWATANAAGHPRTDADLIIASTALEHGMELVTGNTPHFAWIPGLNLADWRQP